MNMFECEDRAGPFIVKQPQEVLWESTEAGLRMFFLFSKWIIKMDHCYIRDRV